MAIRTTGAGEVTSAPPMPHVIDANIVSDPRYLAVAAFLKRCGAPPHVIFAVDVPMYAPGQAVGKRRMTNILFTQSLNQQAGSPLYTLFGNLQDYRQAATEILDRGNYEEDDLALVLATPNATLTQLERSFKFGNPFVDEEIFGYVRQTSEPMVGDTPFVPIQFFTTFSSISEVVGKAIEHGDGSTYYANPRWNPDAAAGTQLEDFDGSRYTLVVRFFIGGIMQRWWKKS